MTWCSPSTGSTVACSRGWGLDRVTAVRAPDPQTVVITLAAPFEPFLRQLDALSAPIVPQHVHDRPGFAVDPRAVLPIGTGPFWMGERWRLTRFDWFAGPKPALAEIACPVLTDLAARPALLGAAQHPAGRRPRGIGRNCRASGTCRPWRSIASRRTPWPGCG